MRNSQIKKNSINYIMDRKEILYVSFAIITVIWLARYLFASVITAILGVALLLAAGAGFVYLTWLEVDEYGSSRSRVMSKEQGIRGLITIGLVLIWQMPGIICGIVGRMIIIDQMKKQYAYMLYYWYDDMDYVAPDGKIMVLGQLLTVIGTIISMYAYYKNAITMYMAYDQRYSKFTPFQLMKIGRENFKGHRKEFAKLQVSFAGWMIVEAILIIVTAKLVVIQGIVGVIAGGFVSAYATTSMAMFYKTMISGQIEVDQQRRAA